MPEEAAGVGHRPAQRDRLAIAGDNRIDTQDVAVCQRSRKPGCIVFQIERAQLRMVHNTFQRDAPAGGNRRSAASRVKQLLDGFLAAQFIDCWLAHAAHKRHLRTRGGNEQHVARLQLHIAGFVAPDQQRVKIKVRDHLACTLQLDVAHGA